METENLVQSITSKDVVLTGDRPTGPLHLGHYVGSLCSRVQLQHEVGKQYVMIADVQALTDNYDNPGKVRENVLEVMADYLAVGIDPAKTTIFIQSMIPEIAELTLFYLNLVTVARLQRNPTVKTEIKQKGFNQSIPAGFFMYPVSQAADITIVKGTVVPVGKDQLPMIEQTNEIVRSFNRLYKTDLFPEPKALVSLTKRGRLSGLDGKAKMSKSLNNAIYLGESEDDLRKHVMSMFTDPDHLRVSDPGKIEGNTVFEYLDIFDVGSEKVKEFKEHYQRGGLGDVILKKYLFEILNEKFTPIRERRAELISDKQELLNILLKGTDKTREIAAQTMKEVKSALCLDY
jgi:tryptophanyl-tRNA synthetase